MHALVQDGVVVRYPYTTRNLRADNPQVSFPKELTDVVMADFGMMAVTPADPPAHDAITENVIEATPRLVVGVWTQSWSVVNASPEEIAERTRAADDAADKEAVKTDSFVDNFIAMTPAQVDTYVDTNITNLPSAKVVIAKLAKMLLLMARREFRDEQP